MFFVEIYVNTSFIFSVSYLTLLQFMFLSDGKVIFYSSIILFKLSKFIVCSCVSVCSLLFWCVVFLFLLVCSSFRLDCSYSSILGVSDIVLMSRLDLLFVFWRISSISRSENQHFFIISLTWSASLWFAIWNIAHSYQISIMSVELLLK